LPPGLQPASIVTMRATALGHAGILIETEQGSIVCDPWFVPAYFGSWFVFPRNDQLPDHLLDALEQPDYLYISHLHADHLDLPFLREHIDRSATVLLPGYPTDELERTLRGLGFETFVRTRDGRPVELADGLRVAIHIETSITDGPGGDSALVVDAGDVRLLDMNDCRIHDMRPFTADHEVDIHWLQYSGAIWYPMVYDYPPEVMRTLVDQKVEAQLARAQRYVEAVGARAVVPSAGPPCFLDPELFGFNVIDGDELSIFPDQRVFLDRLAKAGIDTGHLAIPGTTFTITPGAIEVTQPRPDAEVQAIFEDKRAYLEAYAADWAPWLAEQKRRWHRPPTDLVAQLRAWWEPLLAQAPTLRRGVGANVLLRAGDVAVLIDFPAGEVRAHTDEAYTFSFDIERDLVETVVAERAVDWSNDLFLSCRFKAWRAGEFNEYVYNFFKSLSDERIVRAEAEARWRLAPAPDVEEIELDGYVLERWCPHRQADLSVFGEVCDGVLTCHLHGWQFDLDTGRCLTADDRHLRVRPAETRAPAS
jgi:UDP-MurNAc hydroxylase